MLPKWLKQPPGKTFTLEWVHCTLTLAKPNHNRVVLVFKFQEKEFVYQEAGEIAIWDVTQKYHIGYSIGDLRRDRATIISGGRRSTQREPRHVQGQHAN
ncbi:hypothetical protein ATANTOWER_010287 [Ataeniobius toweri]|uniref:Uncharacterized protein n=1 Tax=Ataeniobius toweri TaxID=208326 RepID=A0ABU7B822_9TELE|nr:hypothetical protein [Ataeniobius toweri]